VQTQEACNTPPPLSSSVGSHRRDADDFVADVARMKAEKAGEQHQEGRGCPGTTFGPDSEADAATVKHAQAAATRLRNGAAFDDWIAVGRALLIGRTEAMRTANTNRPEGKAYAAAFGRWLTTTKLSVADGAVRSRLLDLLDHVADVRKWRETLPVSKRLELNHPTTVWRHWKKSTVVPNPEKPKPLSPIAKLKESIANLEQENHQLKKANGGSTFSAEDRASDVVAVLCGNFSKYKLTEIRRLLGEALNKMGSAQ
jgi:hypothetical protein